MGTTEEEFDETRVGGGAGEGVGEAGGSGVSVSVGVITFRVDVDITDVGDAGSTDAVDCGCSVST